MGANMNSSSNLQNLRQQYDQKNQELGLKRNEQTQTQTQQSTEIARLDASICQNFNKSSQVDQLVTNSQASQTAAEDNLVTMQENEATAQANSTTANDNLSTAQTNQSEAEAASTEAEAALSTATDEYNAAVDEVDIAQTEVDTANTNVSKAKSDLSAKQNEKTSWWDKVKQAVKDAWNAAVNKLKSIVNKAIELYNKAKDKLETALGMKADKERCMKVAEGVSDEAKAKLEERKQECDKAQELADAAAVIYAAAQDSTAVSQEELDAAIKVVQDAQAQKEQVTAEGQQLEGEKSAVQAQYDALLGQLSAAISSGEVDLASLGEQINQLQNEINTQNAQITIQEELAAQLGAEAMDLYAKSDAQTGFGDLANCVSGAFGGGPNGDLKKLEEYKAELEAAIMSGDQKKLEEIYAKINSDSDKKLTKEVMEEAMVANATEEMLSDDDKQAIAEELKRQADALTGKFDSTVEGQGWLSEGLGALNNGLGFGQTENMTKAQIEEYQRQVDQLLKDLEEGKVDNFAARYKAITNESLNPVGADVLTMDADNKEDVAAFKEKYGLASDEEAAAAMKGMKDKTSNSRATEAIMDYESTQATMKEVTVGIAVGVVSAVAVVAAPFTGGASLAIGFAAGGLTKVALESSDALTSAEGKYSWQEGVLDFVSGGIDGAMTAATLGGAGLAGKGLKTVFSSGAKAAVKQTGKTTLKEAFKGTVKSGGRAALTAMGSTSAHYVTDTVGTNALYDLSGGAQRTGGVQNEDGSTTYTVVDKTTGKFIREETVRQGENGEEIVERSNDFSWKEFGKQNLTSASAAFVGAGIGKFSGGYVNPFVSDKTGSTVLGNIFEIGTDMTLSLGADYTMACIQNGGRVDPEEFFTWDRMVGEGQNQIRGLLIGIATSKGNDPAAIAYSTAATKMASGADYDTVIKTMTDAGIPKQDATRFVANDAAQKIISSGGDSNDAIKAMTDKGIDKAEAQSTVTKMEASSQAQKDFGTKGASQTKTDLMNAGYSENEAKNIIKDISVTQAQQAISGGNTDAAKQILTEGGYTDKAADKIIEKQVGAQEAQEAYNNGTDVKTIKEDLKAKGYSKLERDNFVKNMSIEKAQDSISKGDTEAASKALKDAGFSDKQINNSVAEWDAEAKAQIGTELKAIGYHENETNIQACYNIRKAGLEVTKENVNAELGLKNLGVESNKNNIEAYTKLKDAGITVNKENVEIGGKLQDGGVEITKDNMVLGGKIQKTGAEVTKENLEAYNKLGKAGIELTKENIELGAKLNHAGNDVNKESFERVRKYGNNDQNLTNMLLGCKSDTEAETVVQAHKKLSEQLEPDALEGLLGRYSGEVGTAPNGWTASSVFYKELANAVAGDKDGAIKSEINKYVKEGGEYDEIFKSNATTIQPKDFLNLIKNPEYGRNLKAVDTAMKSVPEGSPITVKLEYDGKTVELKLTKDMAEIMKDGDWTNAAVNLATQKQYYNNLEILSPKDGTDPETIEENAKNAKVVDALKSIEPHNANKYLTLGDFEFANFKALVPELEMKDFKGWQQRTIIETVSVTSKFETAMAIAKEPSTFGLSGKVPIEYACIIANSGNSIDDVRQGVSDIKAATGKEFTLASSKDAATLRLFSDVAGIEDMSDLGKKMTAYNALMDAEFYLQAGSKDAQIPKEMVDAFNKKLTAAGVELPKYKNVSVADIANALQKQIGNYATKPFTKGKEAEGILGDLNIKSQADVAKLQTALGTGDSAEISKTINTIMNSAEGFDYSSMRQVLAVDMKKAGLSDDIIKTTLADADIAEDLRHMNKLTSDDSKIPPAEQKNELARLTEDIAIVLATEYPKSVNSPENIENKIADILESASIKEGTPAYRQIMDSVDRGSLCERVVDITSSQRSLAQSELKSNYGKIDPKSGCRIIDANDIDGNGTKFGGYVYAVGALGGSGANSNINDTLIKFHKVIDRADGNYKNEVLSSSYINLGSGMDVTYQDIGVVFKGGENSLIAAVPFDASTHMGAVREQLANYYFDSTTMDISEQGFVHKYRGYTQEVLDANPDGNPAGAVQDAAIISGNQGTIFNKSKTNEAFLLDPEVTALYFKGNEVDIPDYLKVIAKDRNIPIVVIPKK